MNYLTTVHRPGTVRMMSDFDRIFDGVFGIPSEKGHRTPLVDVRETKDAYIVEAEMPGLTEKDIEIGVENDLLIISTQGEEPTEDKQTGYLVRERSTRKFYRSFAVPRDGDANRIDATYKNGVLTVTMQKREDAKPRKISIKAE